MELHLNIKRSDKVILWDAMKPFVARENDFIKNLIKIRFESLGIREIAEAKVAILKCARELEA